MVLGKAYKSQSHLIVKVYPLTNLRAHLYLIALRSLLYPYCQLPLFLPIINLIEVSTGQSSRNRGSSLIDSSRSAGKAPAVPKKRAHQSSQSQKRRRQKTKPDEVLVEPLTYYKAESDSAPEPAASQASQQKRFEVHSQWYKRCNKGTRKHRGRTKKSHIWKEEKGYAIVHEATGIRYY